MTETELTAAVAGLPAGRAAARARASTSTSARSWARSTPGATPSAAASRCSPSIGAGRPGFDTFDVGGGFPVGDPGSGARRPAHFAREVRAAARRAARRTAGRRGSPWSPAGSSSRGAGWLVARVLHVRERADGEPVVVLDAGMTELDPARRSTARATRSWR